ncbi:MAG: endonuclease/exonuclease/phosphatase family protein [Spirochaetota bacterium]
MNFPIISFVSWNIRSSYFELQDGHNAWEYRKESLFSWLNLLAPDVFCLQEALKHQIMDLPIDFLGYNCIGVGREDGETAGEYVPILYREDRFTLLDSGHFWLAPEEYKEKKYSYPAWDAACVRMATWVLLSDNNSDKAPFYVVNTHWDHEGSEARLESAKLILEKLQEYSSKHPTFLLGDFNAEFQSVEVQTLLQGIAKLGGGEAADLCRAAEKRVGGLDWSFHNFGKLLPKDRPLIDYICAIGSKPEAFFIVNAFDQGISGVSIWPSDHMPLLFRCRL